MKENKNQIIVLTQHFFKRFFENEDISLESKDWRKLMTVLILLGLIGGYLSYSLLKRYLFLPDEGTSWIEKSYFISFFMIIIGILSVLQWKNIFLDQVDYANIAPLPIRIRNLFLSKLLSLLSLMSIFFFSTTILSAFLFPLYLTNLDNFNLLSFLRFSGVHLMSCFLAYFFVFIACNLFNGVLMSILSSSFYDKISTYFQIFLLIIFSFSMILFVTFFSLYPEIYSSFSSLKQNNSYVLFMLPSFWFVGLYEWLLGNTDLLFITLARIALLATSIVFVLYLWITLVNYRNLRRNGGVRKQDKKSPKQGKVPRKMFNELFLRDSVQRATFDFFLVTLRKTNKYKLILGGYGAIPVSLFLVLIITFKFTFAVEGFLFYEKLILVLPHILTIFLVIGARIMSSFPESLEANWIFKITEKKDSKNYLIGLEKGIFFLIILPAFLFLFVFYLILLPLKDALLYSLYGLINSSVLIGAVFFNYRKIPFTCTYESKKINTSMILYALGFLFYIYAATIFGYGLLKNPYLFSYYIFIMVMVFVLFKILRKYIHKGSPKILYEESSKLFGLDLE